MTIGGLISVQARINGEMAARLHDAREAALLSFGTGLLGLCVIVLARPAYRRGVSAGRRAYRDGSLRWWQLLGGISGATFVAGQSIAVPRIGVALFTVSAVGAQTANSLFVDRAGLGPAGRRPITPVRVVAAVIAVVAVAISVAGDEGSFSFAPILLAAVGGALLAVQYAINGRVGVATGEPLVAAWVNFLVGFTALLVVYGVGLLVLGGGVHGLPHGPWWLYVAGPIGVLFVSLAAWLVRLLGVLLFSLCAVAGQVAGAVVIDLVAPARPHAVGPATVIGLALVLLAVAIGSGMLKLRRTA